ncbi:secondary thiamine-phosphate synthase enzyme YjbQ [Methanosphaerula subterraneus]|uniref:secondary thiamine-phosphate synthase enzyme YjbQ n=1 Tax=Methanosphaerula subterraneus TaxID=3350244 RepID=UPI003F82C016
MYQRTIQMITHGEGTVIDLSGEVTAVVRESGVSQGLVSLFAVGSTVALTTIEYEPGVLADLMDALARIAPAEMLYAHDRAWGDGNGRSHLKAALVGPSLTIPVSGGRVATGHWQQIVLLELDVRQSRERSVVVSVF